ncbi:MAG: hypothetical protein QOD75_3263 [Blastocatellia bacterium]|nr:hypothetical protein [Blastocatellia bacterium]
MRDNPILDRLIVVGTKALRRGLMSGETLRAPRQQLRWFTPRPSFFFAFPLSKSPSIKNPLGLEIRFSGFFAAVRRVDFFSDATPRRQAGNGCGPY